MSSTVVPGYVFFQARQVTMLQGSDSSLVPESSPSIASPRMWLQSVFVSTSCITRLRSQSMPETAKVSLRPFTSAA